MFEVQIFAKDSQGSLQAVTMAPEGTTLTNTQGGVARTANPSAISDGGAVRSSYDDLGRQLVRPYQVRDLVATGYAALTFSQEATVLSAVVGAYLDLVSITATNTSSVAVPVTIRASSGGSTQLTIVVPAGGTVTRDFLVPKPQSDTGNNWTAQNAIADQSDSTVTVEMIAIREI